ncbi:hypothetical protein [Chitinilyticum litopenaei]|uniref:hypothetical protein n=1 Tax=Chitinilyticum litopenaei TaxID=1121276 RepID=UPI00040513E3|nr:hypothetical protein [Chitinilyticum litopenaei]
MYDCSVSEEIRPALRPAQSASPARHALQDFRRSRLTLAAPAGPGALQLNKAFAVASGLGLAVVQHDNGSLDVLDVALDEALLFARRFPGLLIRYEPARPWVRST